MEIVNLIFTLVIFGLLIAGIRKKVPLMSLMLGLTVVCLIYLLCTGKALLADSSGSRIVDIFEYLAQSFSSTLAGMGITIVFVLAYASFIQKIHATDALANLIYKPVGKIKSPVMLIIILAIITALLRIPISTGPALLALMLSIFAPVLKQRGISLADAMPAFIVPLAISWGPADTGLLAALSLMVISETVNVSEWFVTMQLPIVAVVICVMSILLWLYYRLFAKKDTEKADQAAASEAAGVPVCYAVLPILPIIFLLVFSPLATGIVMSVSGCIFACLAVAVIMQLICTHSVKDILKTMELFYDSFAESIRGVGMFIVIAIMFSGTVTKIGGMTVIADFLSRFSIPTFILILLIVVFAAVLNMLIGSFFGSLGIMIPLGATICGRLGINPELMCYFIVYACCTGAMFSPASPTIIIALQESGMTMSDFMRRNLIPAVGALLAVVIAGSLLFL